MAKAFFFTYKYQGVDFVFKATCSLRHYDVYYAECNESDLYKVNRFINPILYLPVGMRMLLRCRRNDDKLYKDTAIGVSTLEKALDETDLYHESRWISAYEKMKDIFPNLTQEDFFALSEFIVGHCN